MFSMIHLKLVQLACFAVFDQIKPECYAKCRFIGVYDLFFQLSETYWTAPILGRLEPFLLSEQRKKVVV